MFYDDVHCLMIMYNVLWWCTMFDDNVQCTMFYDDVQCLMIMYSVLRWCIVFYDDVQCFMMVYSVLWWCTVFYDDVQCFMMMYSVLWWCTVYYDDVQCFMMMYNVSYRWVLCLRTFFVHTVIMAPVVNTPPRNPRTVPKATPTLSLPTVFWSSSESIHPQVVKSL